MEIYRIAHSSYSQLLSYGAAGRWNSSGVEVIYTASNRSLACLEVVVHKNSDELKELFRIMVIHIPDKSFKKIDLTDLLEGWHLTDNNAYNICRLIGNDWAVSNKSLILQVPSSIIKNETNFLINVNHDDFSKVKVTDIEPFFFDPRIKNEK